MKNKISFLLFMFVIHAFAKHANGLYPESKISVLKELGNSSSKVTIALNSNGNYNEIPYGVELITSEEDWLLSSPQKAYCCYTHITSVNNCEN